MHPSETQLLYFGKRGHLRAALPPWYTLIVDGDLGPVAFLLKHNTQ